MKKVCVSSYVSICISLLCVHACVHVGEGRTLLHMPSEVVYV